MSMTLDMIDLAQIVSSHGFAAVQATRSGRLVIRASMLCIQSCQKDKQMIGRHPVLAFFAA